MKKTFEFSLMLIIFYGVFTAFSYAALVFNPEPNTVWIAITSLLASAGLMLLYAQLVRISTQKILENKITNLEGDVRTKDQELKNAFKIKRAVEDEAEKTIPLENTQD